MKMLKVEIITKLLLKIDIITINILKVLIVNRSMPSSLIQMMKILIITTIKESILIITKTTHLLKKTQSTSVPLQVLISNMMILYLNYRN